MCARRQTSVFEKNPANVERFVRENGLHYPIVLDNEYRLWNAYANHYWPRKLLIDGKGIIRYDHAGEGEYAQTERAIQELLREIHPGLSLPPVEVDEQEHLRGICYPTTPELYCGYYRGVLGNKSGYVPDRPFLYVDQDHYEDGKIYLQGLWAAHAEYVEPRNTTGSQGSLSLPYHALAVNAVMRTSAGRPVRASVSRDDAPVPLEAKGDDLMADGEDTHAVVDEPRMYNLVRDSKFGAHLLRIRPESAGLEIYAFTFGGCRVD